MGLVSIPSDYQHFTFLSSTYFTLILTFEKQWSWYQIQLSQLEKQVVDLHSIHDFPWHPFDWVDYKNNKHKISIKQVSSVYPVSLNGCSQTDILSWSISVSFAPSSTKHNYTCVCVCVCVCVIYIIYK